MYTEPKLWNELQKLDDRELAEIALDEHDPRGDAADDVLDYRQSIAADPRVAQAFGEAAI